MLCLLALPGFLPAGQAGGFEALAQTSKRSKSHHSTKTSHSTGSSHGSSHNAAAAGGSHSSRRRHGASSTAAVSAVTAPTHGRRGRHSKTAAAVESAPVGPHGRRGRHHGKGSHAMEVTASSKSGHIKGKSHKGKETAGHGEDQDDAALEAQAAAEAPPRLRNYSLLGNAYALYDQGVNERLKGNYGLSTDKLTEAAKLIDQASSIGRDGRPSTMAAMVFFELGQSAEADNDLTLARDSYVHAVKAKPDYVEAYMHLVNVLATDGKVRQALNYLKDGLRECPHDARLNAMLTQLGGFMGEGRNSGEGNDMSLDAASSAAPPDKAVAPAAP